MSTTIATPRTAPAPASTPEILLQPLARLQRSIRRYVILEGVAWLVIFACLWAVFTFLCDWGLLFALFGLDYLRDGGPAVSWFLRSVFLGTLCVGIGVVLVYHFLYRLSATFSRDELALVLERRFPHLLGDRLLTAVQLSDPEQARKYYYSWDLVQVTVKEAADRVTQLNLGQAFNWTRLLQRLALAILLLGGVVATFLFATDHAALWAERNFFLEQVFWPRAYILEVPDFADATGRAVPYGEEQRVTIRTWKWVAACRTNPEGWRRLEWADLLPGDRPERPWELAPGRMDPALFALLPVDWQKLTLDEVEVRLSTLNDVQRRDLGLALIRRVRNQFTSSDSGRLGLQAIFHQYLPSSWQEVKDPATLRTFLLLAERLTSADLKLITDRLEVLAPLQADVQLALAFSLAPIQPPLLSGTVLERGLAPGRTATPRELLSAAEWTVLPATFKALSRADLRRRLQQFQQDETAEALGRLVESRLKALFAELGERTQQTHLGRRRGLRRLFTEVADVQVFLTFEPIVEGGEPRPAGKSGRQEVRRLPNTNDFTYVFKKIESPFRFRAEAGRTATPWYRVLVKPLPQLKHLRQTNDEPGYLHNSNTRVTTGPHTISLIGPEWRTEAPVGSRILWEAECIKPLREVQLTSENGSEQPVVIHTTGSASFTAQLRRFTSQTLLLQLRLTDTDGITFTRSLRLVPVLDKEPVFESVSFPVLNPKMITNQAILPLTGTVTDDHGLTGLQYEVMVQQMDRKIIYQGRVPFRHFPPLYRQGLVPADFRWESMTDLTQAKLQTGIRGDPFFFLPVVALLPSTGAWGLLQIPRGELPRTQNYEYLDEQTYGKAYQETKHEYLDTLLLRTVNPGATDRPLAQPPYRLLVRLVATDSRMLEEGKPVPAPQEGKTDQMFEFLVVDERTLMVEVGNKEEELHAQSQDIVRMVQKARDDLTRVSKELAGYKSEELRKVAEDVRLTNRTLAEQRQLTRARVLLPFRAAYRELALNRCQPQVLDRLDRRICFPLTELVSPKQPFDRAGQLLDELANRLETDASTVTGADFTPSLREVNEIIRRFESVMKEMQKLIEFNQALKVLEEIIRGEQELRKRIDEKYKKEKDKELDP